MKKTILILSVLMLCATFVIANYTTVESLGTSGDYKVTFDQPVKKGWNLLPADKGAWSLSSDMPEESFLQNIKAYLIYLPLQNKYVNALSGFSQTDFPYVQANEDYLQTATGWFYFTGDTTLSYIVEDGGVMPNLHQGWNLVSINPMMTELNSQVATTDKFPRGDCIILKAYMWDSVEQMWESIGDANSIHDSLDEFKDNEAIGVGLALKVKSTCQLGVSSEGVTPPPALPN